MKEYLRLNVPKPWFQVKADIKAPPLTASYGWTGTAFDYAMRFYLQKLTVARRRGAGLRRRAPRWSARAERARARRSASGPSSRLRRIACAPTSTVGATKNSELIRAAIDLAQLDLVYRVGLLDLQPINDAMVEDIGNMLVLVRPEEFRAKRTCLLNPTFGAASELVGGADGDLVLDGTLIDVKVNKNLEMGRDIFNQLVGYYCLSCIGGIDGCRGKITCVAVYFARFGILHRLPVNSFVEAGRLPVHLKWFKATANRGVNSM